MIVFQRGLMILEAFFMIIFFNIDEKKSMRGRVIISLVVKISLYGRTKRLIMRALILPMLSLLINFIKWGNASLEKDFLKGQKNSQVVFHHITLNN